MLEGKTFGIFHLLDEECRMPSPKTTTFMQKVISNHANCKTFSLPNKIASHGGPKSHNCFVIQHFGHKVRYTTVREYYCSFRLVLQMYRYADNDSTSPFYIILSNAVLLIYTHL